MGPVSHKTGPIDIMRSRDQAPTRNASSGPSTRATTGLPCRADHISYAAPHSAERSSWFTSRPHTP